MTSPSNEIVSIPGAARRGEFDLVLEYVSWGLAICGAGEVFSYVNPAFAAMHGFTPDELIGMSEWILYPPEELARARRETGGAASMGSVVFETAHFKKDGSIFPIRVSVTAVRDEEGAFLYNVVSAEDLTELRRAQDAANRLSTAVQNAAEAIVVTGRDGAILDVNPAFETLTGYTAAEVIGQNPRVLKSGRQPPQFYENLWSTISSGSTWRGTMINRRRDGTLYEESATISPIKAVDSGHITGFVAVKRDITTERKLELHIQEAQRMDAIATLAGGIAHDFNNILSAILGFSEISIPLVEGNRDVEENLSEVIVAGRRARDLVRQILAFSRQTSQEARPLMVRPIINEALKLLHSSLPKSIQIRADLRSDSKINGDPSEVHQVLMNLATNSSKAMRGKGGTLTVSLSEENIDFGTPAMPPGLMPGTYLTLTVADTGVGMTPSVLERAFDPYFSTNVEQSGLGLSVVHGLVTKAGGAVALKSAPGKGTEVRVFWPVLIEEQNDASTHYEALPTGIERVLFIDDEEFQIILAEKMLGRLGYKVVAMRDPVAALEIFRSDPRAFDLVFSDVSMPGMNGFELTKKVKEARPEIPVILSTGYSEQYTVEKSPDSGVAAFVYKPVVMRTMAETIRAVLEPAQNPKV